MKKKVIIYGAGDYGKRLLYFIRNVGGNIDYFCQTKCEENMYCNDIKVIDVEYLAEMSEELIVLIAIWDNQVSGKIKSYLLNLNRSDIYIYELGDFIKNNIPDIGEKDYYYCNICGKNVKGFETAVWGLSEIFDKYHVIGGGGIRKNTYCPLCKSTERKRWQYWVLCKHTNIFKDKCVVLHIAPERGISERIQANELCDYYSGNIIQSNWNKYIVNVTNIQFRDGFFDYIIMNHVLEHVEDEVKAINEIKRVLKKDGKIILSFPICMDIDTYENPLIQTPEERLREYGQEDHVRLYGRDYKLILERYGLNVEIYSPQNECSDEVIVKYGFSYDDVIMICTVI